VKKVVRIGRMIGHCRRKDIIDMIKVKKSRKRLRRKMDKRNLCCNSNSSRSSSNNRYSKHNNYQRVSVSS